MGEDSSQPPEAHDSRTAGNQGSGDLADSEYWDNARHVSLRPSRISTKLHRVLARHTDRLYSQLLKRSPQDSELIELGCAPGWTLARIHRVRPDLSLNGIDYAEGATGTTKELLSTLSVESRVVHGDIAAHTPAVGYETVLSAGLVEHFDDPQEMLSHHFRLTRPGGHVVVTVPNLATPLVAMIAKRLSPRDFETHNLGLMAPDALGEHIRLAGFEQVEAGAAGGASLFVPRNPRSGLGRTLYSSFAYAANLLFALLPEGLSPWQQVIWARGVRPHSRSGKEERTR